MVKDGKLFNKKFLSQWEHGDKIFNLPSEGDPGLIESADNYSFDVSKDVDKNNKSKVVLKKSSLHDGQMWIRGRSDVDGWFILENVLTGRFLSAGSGWPAMSSASASRLANCRSALRLSAD